MERNAPQNRDVKLYSAKCKRKIQWAKLFSFGGINQKWINWTYDFLPMAPQM